MWGKSPSNKNVVESGGSVCYIKLVVKRKEESYESFYDKMSGAAVFTYAQMQGNFLRICEGGILKWADM